VHVRRCTCGIDDGYVEKRRFIIGMVAWFALTDGLLLGGWLRLLGKSFIDASITIAVLASSGFRAWRSGKSRIPRVVFSCKALYFIYSRMNVDTGTPVHLVLLVGLSS
jgi:hypothetical protein